MKTVLNIFFFFFFFLSLNAQNLSGKVTDTENQPIEFANVALYSLPDSAMITGTVTNQHGEFSLTSTGAKNAFLKISFIGYETKNVSATSGQTVILQNDSKLLDEVVVKGSRKLYKIENGAIVASVKNTVLETLPNANEVIAQLPFLSGQDGSFTVFGKGTPIIYINNRLVRNNKELEQLSPSDIKTIQVITTPGAQYDAMVKAVIKITTEKPVGEGLSGMLYAQGKQASVFSGSEYVSLNYRAGAWDVFGSAFLNQQRYKTDLDATQRLLLAGDPRQQIYKTYEKNGYNSAVPIVGVNFNPNKSHSAGIRYTYDYTNWKGDIENNITHTGNNISEKIKQLGTSISLRNNHNINAYYNGVLTDKLSLNINADLAKGNEKDEMDTYFEEKPTDILHISGIRDYDLYAGKGIFSYVLGKGMLETGGEYTHTRFLQTYAINKPELGIDNTNDKAVQNRGALFISYQTQLGKMGLSSGIRYENIHMDYYENDVLNKEQSRKYNHFFPNLSLSYATGNTQTALVFERKIYYPSYRQLRSNIQYSSPFVYESGNPLLQPKIENSFSAMLAWKNVQAMAGFSVNENDIQPIPQQYKDQPIILLRDENIHRTKNANFGISYSFTFGIWRPQFEVGGMWQWLNLENENREYNKPMFSGKWNNTFSLPQQWTLRVDAVGNGRGHNGVAFIQPSWGIDLHLSKQLLNKRLTMNLAAVDIFKTRTNKWEMNYGKVNFLYNKNIDSRFVSLTITYRFNSTNSKYREQQASDELNRLK